MLKILLADDDAFSRRVLRASLSAGGYEVLEAVDGAEAWSILDSHNTPRLALLDWMMPRMDGVDLCRRIRARRNAPYMYLILITAKDRSSDIVTGLEAGADDYLTKPCDPDELRCRVRAGERILQLKSDLEQNIADLEAALAHVEKLQGLLPICMHCKSIRDDSNTWHRIETYIERHSDAMFTHALCISCLETHYPEYADADNNTVADSLTTARERVEPPVVASPAADNEPED